MLTNNNCIRLCPDCPNREYEGTTPEDRVTGDLVERRASYINARLEFLRDPAETPDVPAQEFGIRFVDTEGNVTPAFFPGVQLEDIANCGEPILVRRSGFLYRKKHYDCGAQTQQLKQLRARIKKRNG